MNHRTRCLTALALVTALAAAGCSGAVRSEGKGADGSELTVTASTPPISLDPAKSNSGSGELFVDLAYSSLLHSTSKGTYEPALAKSFGYEGTGNTTFVLHLRDKLRFSDGSTLNSSAVKGYLDYYANKAAGPFAATASIIKAIDTPDPLTVRLHLKSASPDLPFQFSESGMWGAIISPKALAAPEKLGTSTAGAGPFMLDRAQSVSGSKYVYVKNPHYYAPEQRKYTKVVVNVIADFNAAMQSVVAGQAQWAQGTADQVAAAKKAGLKHGQAVSAAVSLFIQDRKGKIVPALGDERVRQALNMAVDREAIADALHGKPLQQIIAPGRTGYSKKAQSTYAYDVAKAKKLLAEAGYAKGFTFDSIIGAFDPAVVTTAQALADQFSKIGVRMRIVTAPTFADYARQQESAKFPTTVAVWGSTTMFTVAQQLVLPTGVVNPFHSADSELTGLFNRAAAMPAGKAVPVWQQLSERVTQKAWFVPVASNHSDFFGADGINAAGDGFTWPNPLHF